jgi:hypothetical protein
MTTKTKHDDGGAADPAPCARHGCVAVVETCGNGTFWVESACGWASSPEMSQQKALDGWNAVMKTQKRRREQEGEP